MRVLIVEDQPDIRETVRLQFLAANFMVDVAPNANRGLFKATVNRYDLIILDVNLPDGDGFTICHEVRQEKILTPVLMLTIRDDVGDKIHALETGADDYMTKPYHPDELIARANVLLRRRTCQTTAIYTAGSMVLKTRERELRYKGALVKLTRREFDLLQYMLEHDAEVIRREDMWEKVWGWDDYPLHNTVDVHIKRLRDKLQDHGGRLIETIRGVGYRFQAPED